MPSRTIVNPPLENISVNVSLNPKDGTPWAHFVQGKFEKNTRHNRVSLEASFTLGIGQKLEAIVTGSLNEVSIKEGGDFPVFLEKITNGNTGEILYSLHCGGPKAGFEKPISQLWITPEGAKNFPYVAKWMRSEIKTLNENEAGSENSGPPPIPWTKSGQVTGCEIQQVSQPSHQSHPAPLMRQDNGVSGLAFAHPRMEPMKPWMPSPQLGDPTMIIETKAKAEPQGDVLGSVMESAGIGSALKDPRLPPMKISRKKHQPKVEPITPPPSLVAQEPVKKQKRSTKRKLTFEVEQPVNDVDENSQLPGYSSWPDQEYNPEFPAMFPDMF